MSSHVSLNSELLKKNTNLLPYQSDTLPGTRNPDLPLEFQGAKKIWRNYSAYYCIFQGWKICPGTLEQLVAV
jgi:hypothetical protein